MNSKKIIKNLKKYDKKDNELYLEYCKICIRLLYKYKIII